VGFVSFEVRHLRFRVSVSGVSDVCLAMGEQNSLKGIATILCSLYRVRFGGL